MIVVRVRGRGDWPGTETLPVRSTKVTCSLPTAKGGPGEGLGTARDPALSAPFRPVPGHWNHVAYTFDDGAKQQVLYIDGIPVASGSANDPIAYAAQPLLLGCGMHNGALDSFLHGRIDDASIYNRALSGAEIASVYNAGPAGKHL